MSTSVGSLYKSGSGSTYIRIHLYIDTKEYACMKRRYQSAGACVCVRNFALFDLFIRPVGTAGHQLCLTT